MAGRSHFIGRGKAVSTFSEGLLDEIFPKVREIDPGRPRRNPDPDFAIDPASPRFDSGSPAQMPEPNPLPKSRLMLENGDRFPKKFLERLPDEPISSEDYLGVAFGNPDYMAKFERELLGNHAPEENGRAATASITSVDKKFTRGSLFAPEEPQDFDQSAAIPTTSLFSPDANTTKPHPPSKSQEGGVTARRDSSHKQARPKEDDGTPRSFKDQDYPGQILVETFERAIPASYEAVTDERTAKGFEMAGAVSKFVAEEVGRQIVQNGSRAVLAAGGPLTASSSLYEGLQAPLKTAKVVSDLERWEKRISPTIEKLQKISEKK